MLPLGIKFSLHWSESALQASTADEALWVSGEHPLLNNSSTFLPVPSSCTELPVLPVALVELFRLSMRPLFPWMKKHFYFFITECNGYLCKNLHDNRDSLQVKLYIPQCRKPRQRGHTVCLAEQELAIFTILLGCFKPYSLPSLHCTSFFGFVSVWTLFLLCVIFLFWAKHSETHAG